MPALLLCRRWLMLVLAMALPACARLGTMPAAPPAERVEVGIAAINDFHGALLPPATQPTAGGAAALASTLDTIRARHRYHLTVSAGDLIGASPLISALFLDEPTIGVMNRIGLDFNAVGNHEFDRGRAELLRMAKGGCAKYTLRQPCQIEQYHGAKFPFLAANTLTETGQPLFAASAIRHFGTGRQRIAVGLIGLTLAGTGALSSPGGTAGLHWAEEAATANAEIVKLKAQGANAIVLLIHQGGRTSGPADANGCTGFSSGNEDIRRILDQLDPRVDVVVSGHTHWAYVCDYPSRDPARAFLLTSAGYGGRLVTAITLSIDPARHLPVRATAQNIGVTAPARADIAAYVARYAKASADVASRRVGWLAGPAARPAGALANTGGPLGALVADAQLAATQAAGAHIALTNPFGLRSALLPAAGGSISFAQIHAVQPFMNELVTQTLTGAELKTALEQGLDSEGPEQILSASAGFAYGFDRSQASGQRITTMVLNGQPIAPGQNYRVTTNMFLANGGDGFSGLTKGRTRTIGTSDIAALESWLKAIPPRAPPTQPREVGR